MLAGKAPAAVQPVDTGGDADGSLLDAAMAFVEVGCGGGIAGPGIVEEALDLAHQPGLVGLDREKIVGPGVEDGLRRACVAADRVDGDQRARDLAPFAPAAPEGVGSSSARSRRRSPPPGLGSGLITSK